MTTEIDPAVMAALRKEITEQVTAELSAKDERERAEREQEQQIENAAHDMYITKMKQSTTPWVEIIGNVEVTEQGIKVSLEWNNAFVEFLKTQGISGSDEDEIVRHWIAMLLRNMEERMAEENPEQSDYS